MTSHDHTAYDPTVHDYAERVYDLAEKLKALRDMSQSLGDEMNANARQQSLALLHSAIGPWLDRAPIAHLLNTAFAILIYAAHNHEPPGPATREAVKYLQRNMRELPDGEKRMLGVTEFEASHPEPPKPLALTPRGLPRRPVRNALENTVDIRAHGGLRLAQPGDAGDLARLAEEIDAFNAMPPVSRAG